LCTAGGHARQGSRQALQFLPEDFLSLLSLCLIRAQLDQLPPVDANDVIVCHCSDAPARRSFRRETDRPDSRRSAEIGKQAVGVARLRMIHLMSELMLRRTLLSPIG
jgi:hypothetical protein